jgi:peptidoglycan/LPS O-acetylase OafA/YrhL
MEVEAGSEEMSVSDRGREGLAGSPPFAGDPGYIPGFDGIRAIAVLFVLVAHAGFGDLVPGGFGVTVFFAISGYLITTLLLKETSKTGTVNLKLFYARRILRLYPELIALVLMCLITGVFLPLHASVTEKFAGLFYYMNYYYVFGLHYPVAESYPWRQLWSLAIEEHFYFFFPILLMALATTKRARIVFISFLIVAPLLWRFVTYFVLGLPWQYNYVATDARIDSIAWGCLLAVLLRAQSGMPAAPQTLWFIRTWVVPVAAAMILFSLVYRSEDFRWTWRFTIQGMALALLIGNLLFDPRWRIVVRILELRPIRFVGRISYGLYLYHMLVNQILGVIFPRLPQFAFLSISLVISLLIAALSYFLLESPLKVIRRRLGSHVR